MLKTRSNQKSWDKGDVKTYLNHELEKRCLFRSKRGVADCRCQINLQSPLSIWNQKYFFHFVVCVLWQIIYYFNHSNQFSLTCQSKEILYFFLIFFNCIIYLPLFLFYFLPQNLYAKSHFDIIILKPTFPPFFETFSLEIIFLEGDGPLSCHSFRILILLFFCFILSTWNDFNWIWIQDECIRLNIFLFLLRCLHLDHTYVDNGFFLNAPNSTSFR